MSRYDDDFSVRERCAWGRYPRIRQRSVFWLKKEENGPSLPRDASLLCYGCGRSYGDVCLNADGTLLDLSAFNSFSLDDATGILRAEGGAILGDILAAIIPRGWIVPAIPGTAYVTVGGMIANDVHGKNHHVCGTIGNAILRLTLLQSDGKVLSCSRHENADLFAATIGGLGLTGVILDAEMQMLAVPGPSMDCESIRFSSPEECMDLLADGSFAYTAAWMHCESARHFGEGILRRANHIPSPTGAVPAAPRQWRVPFALPLLNQWTSRLWNDAVLRRQRVSSVRTTMHYTEYFFPLDAIADWNLLCGANGFVEYHCVVPRDAAVALLSLVCRTRPLPFFAAVKIFGAMPSPGMLSFPREGISLAFDYPATAETLHLLRAFDDIVTGSGGRIYPAKDARMPAQVFQNGYPRWREFSRFIDPAFSSSFWRRVSATMSSTLCVSEK